MDNKIIESDDAVIKNIDSIIQILNKSCVAYGAEIIIQIKRYDGEELTAKFIDHASLVQELIAAFENFKTEV